jgi:sugar-phosphatase
MTEKLWNAEAVLFDLDGVLVDTIPVLVGLQRRWAALHGLDPELVVRSSPGRRERELVALLAPHLDVDTELQRFADWQQVALAQCPACPGARELVAAMRPGKWAVVTSGNRAGALDRLNGAGLPVPDVLVTAEDVVHGKPDPAPYLRAAELLGVEPADCVVIEDAPSGATAGKRAGMRVLGVVADDSDESIGADVHVRSLDEVYVDETAIAVRIALRARGPLTP